MSESIDVLPDWDVPGATEQPYPAVAAEMQTTLAGDSSGHDLAHAWRVFSLGRSIATEENADPHVVGLAALVHDHHRVVNGHELVHPEATLEDVEAILRAAGVAADGTIEAVQHCVAVHDDYVYRDDPGRPETIEAAVLQDADNLDALGAVGVGRCFAFGGDRGLPLWRPGDGDDPCVLGHFDERCSSSRTSAIRGRHGRWQPSGSSSSSPSPNGSAASGAVSVRADPGRRRRPLRRNPVPGPGPAAVPARSGRPS